MYTCIHVYMYICIASDVTFRECSESSCGGDGSRRAVPHPCAGMLVLAMLVLTIPGSSHRNRSQYYIIYYTILDYTILYSTILYSTILYYTMLYYRFIVAATPPGTTYRLRIRAGTAAAAKDNNHNNNNNNNSSNNSYY